MITRKLIKIHKIVLSFVISKLEKTAKDLISKQLINKIISTIEADACKD